MGKMSEEEKIKAKEEQAKKEAKKAKIKDLMEEMQIKNVGDIDNYLSEVMGTMMQIMMDAEFEEYMGYEKNKQENEDGNYRNGYSSKGKKVKTKYGDIEIDTPRDRKGEFEPIVVPKRTRVLDGIEDAIILMISKGISLKDVKEMLQEVYKIKLSEEKISKITERVSEELEIWKKRELKKMYAVMYVDCMYVKIKEDYKSEKRPIYVVVGIDLEGKKEVLGFYIGDSTGESATYWRRVFEDIKERGVEDVIYTVFDGLAGLDEVAQEEFVQTTTQRCIVHIVRNLYKRCARKDAKEIIGDFKKIYTASIKEGAEEEYKKFMEKYKDKKEIVKYVADNIEHVMGLFEYTVEIRKMIYTTNTVEAVNGALRKVTKRKGVFINERSVEKVIYLRIKDLEKKWAEGTKNWKKILVQLIEIYGERVTKYIEEK